MQNAFDFRRRDSQRIEKLLRDLDAALDVAKGFPVNYADRPDLVSSFALLTLQRLRVESIRRIPFDDRPPELIDSEEWTFQAMLGKVRFELQAALDELTSRN